MVVRVAVLTALALSVFVSPWWLTIFFTIIVAVWFDRFYEAVVIGLFIDLVYGFVQAGIFNLSLPLTLIFLLLVWILSILKKRILFAW